MNRVSVLAVFFTLVMVLSLPAMGTAALAPSSTDDTASQAGMGSGPAEDPTILNDASTPMVMDEVETAASSGNETTILVQLGGADRSVVAGTDGADGTIAALQEYAEMTQAPLITYAEETPGVTVEESLWIANVVALTVDFEQVDLRDLLEQPHISAIHPNYETTHVSEFEFDTPDPYTDSGCQPFDAEPECDPDEQWLGIDKYDLAASGHGFNVSWPLTELNVTHTWDDGNLGDGAKVASIDTGTDVRHPDIDLFTKDPDDSTYPGGHARFSGPINYDHLETGTHIQDALPIPGQALSEENTTHEINETANPHGTAASSIVGGGNASGIHVGVAPEADLLVGDVDEIFWLAEAAAIQWAVEQDADAMHVNFGGGNDGVSALAKEIFRNAAHSGTLVVAPTGNHGEGTTNTRAQPQTLSVGATTGANNVTGYSGGMERTGAQAHGYPWWPEEWTEPDIVAPGQRGLSAQQIGQEEFKERGPNGMWNYFAGTSMANPYVAGIAGLVEASVERDLHPHTIKSAIVSTAREDPYNPLPITNKSYSPGEDDREPTRMGAGLPDVDAATELVENEHGVQGTVYWRGTDDPNQQTPIVDAYIETEDDAPRAPAQFITGPDGQFELPLPPGEHDVTIDAFGFEEKTITVEVDEDGGYEELDIELDRIADVAHVHDAPDEVDPGMTLAGPEGNSYSTQFEVRNIQQLDIELTDDSTVDPDSVTVLVNNQQFSIGETTGFGVAEPIDSTPMVVTAIPDAGTGGETIGLELTVRSHGSYGNTEHETVVRPGTAEITSPIRVAEDEGLPQSMQADETATMRLESDDLAELELGLNEESTITSDQLDLTVNGEPVEFDERLTGEAIVGDAPMTEVTEDLILGAADADWEPTLTQRPSEGAGATDSIGVSIAHDDPLVSGETTETTVTVHETGTHDPVSEAEVEISGAGVDQTVTTDQDGLATVEVTPEDDGEITVTATEDDRETSLTTEVHSDAPSVITVPDDESTIQSAIDAADEGAVILLEGGTYEEALTIDHSVTIKAMVGHDVTITDPRDDPDEPAVEISGDEVTVSDVAIESPDNDGIVIDEPASDVGLHGLAVDAAGTAVEVLHAEGHEISGSELVGESYGILASHGSDLLIRDSHIHGFGTAGMFLGGGAPTRDDGFFAGVNDLDIGENLVEGADATERAGIQLGRASDGATIHNNTVVDIDDWGIRVDFNTHDVDIVENTIENVGVGFSEHFTETSIRHNEVTGADVLFESTAHNAQDDDSYRPIEVTKNVFTDFEYAFDLDHGEVDPAFELPAAENLYLMEDSTMVTVDPADDAQGSFALDVIGIAGPGTDEVSFTTETTEVISLETPVIHVPTAVDTLDEALDIVPEDGTIVLEEGTYDAVLELDQPVTIQGAPGADVTIEDPRESVSADDPALVTVQESDVALKNVDLVPTADGTGVFLDEAAIETTVADLSITPETGSLSTGIEVIHANDHTIKGVTIESAENGIIGTHGSGLTITDSRILEFDQHGMFLGGGAPTADEGFWAGVDDMEITHNSLSGDPGDQGAIRLGRTSDDSVVANNTVTDVEGWGVRIDFNTHGIDVTRNELSDVGVALSEHFTETTFTRNEIRDSEIGFQTTAHDPLDEGGRDIAVTHNVFEDVETFFDLDHGEVDPAFELPAGNNYYIEDEEILEELDEDDVQGEASVDSEPIRDEAPTPVGVADDIRLVVEWIPPLEVNQPLDLQLTVHEKGTQIAVPDAAVTLAGLGIDEQVTTDENGQAELQITPSEHGELVMTAESDDRVDQVMFETDEPPLVEHYDTTGDGEIDHDGLSNAIDDWLTSDLSLGELKEVIDLWASGT